jgi:RimJ/RimL family protein N-acetyltransferase
LPRLCEFNNDLEVELAGGGDPPYPQALARLQAEYDQDSAKGGRDGNRFAIEADGQFIGQCALFNQDATAQTAELGIAIGDKAYWGRGYGRECIELLLRHAFQHHHYHKVWLRVNASNARAIKAYQACGFVEEGRQKAHVWNNGRYDDLVLMGQLADDWRQRQNA